MKRLACATALMALSWTAALAAPGCRISAIATLLTPPRIGAQATMQVANTGRPCGEMLWVSTGVIPFTRLLVTRAPRHGVMDMSEPSAFTYRPLAGYGGRDRFDLIAYGDGANGESVTGALHMTVAVTR